MGLSNQAGHFSLTSVLGCSPQSRRKSTEHVNHRTAGKKANTPNAPGDRFGNNVSGSTLASAESLLPLRSNSDLHEKKSRVLELSWNRLHRKCFAAGERETGYASDASCLLAKDSSASY